MFEITIHRVFSAAHALRLYDGSIEPLHGHNWTVDLTVGSQHLDKIEIVMDFHELERIVDALIAQLDGYQQVGVTLELDVVDEELVIGGEVVG